LTSFSHNDTENYISFPLRQVAWEFSRIKPEQFSRLVAKKLTLPG
jgi:hypothetical protein